jgi:asparagine synthetase B (glutamine-hydrolysing)
MSHAQLFSAEWGLVGQILPSATVSAMRRLSKNWDADTNDPLGLSFPAYRAFDLRQWLANVFLEKSDRASMLHSLEVRVPFVDPVVANAASEYVPQDSRKGPLREALYAALPDVQLPSKKMGLSVASDAVTDDAHLEESITRVINDRESVLNQIGMNSPELLSSRARTNSGLRFRLATLGVWDEIWSNN